MNPYEEWIDTSGPSGVLASARTMRDLTERAATAAGSAEQDRMRRAFLRSTTYEWMFFDAAHHLQTWPDPGAARVPAPPHVQECS